MREWCFHYVGSIRYWLKEKDLKLWDGMSIMISMIQILKPHIVLWIGLSMVNNFQIKAFNGKPLTLWLLTVLTFFFNKFKNINIS